MCPLIWMTHCHNSFKVPGLTQLKGWGFSVGAPGKDLETLKNQSCALFKEKHIMQESLAHRQGRRTPLAPNCSWNTDKLKVVIDKGIRRWSNKERETCPTIFCSKTSSSHKWYKKRRSLSWEILVLMFLAILSHPC